MCIIIFIYLMDFKYDLDVLFHEIHPNIQAPNSITTIKCYITEIYESSVQ